MVNELKYVYIVFQKNGKVVSVHSNPTRGGLAAQLFDLREESDVSYGESDAICRAYEVQDGPYPSGDKVYEVWCSQERTVLRVFNNLEAANKLANTNSNYRIFEHIIFAE